MHMQKLLAAVAILLGLVFGASGWQKIQEGRASFGWPRVPGKVLQASSEADLRRRVEPLAPGETEVVYRPRIEYTYVGMHVTQVAPTGGGLAVGAPCNTRYGWGSMTAACAISR